MSFNEKQTKKLKGKELSLRLLVRNLLTNAISYASPGGKVTIDLLANDSKLITLIIEGSGPSILEADRE